MLRQRVGLEHAVLLAGFACAVIVWIPGSASDPERFAVPKEAVLHLSVVLAICGGAARGIPLEYDRTDVLVFLFVVFGWLSVFAVAQNPWAASRGAAISTSGALVFYLTRRVYPPATAIVSLAIAVVGMGVAIWILAEAYRLIPPISLPARAPGGPFGNRSRAAHLLAIILPVALACASTGYSSRLRSALITSGTVAIAAALVITRSRAAWIAAVVGLTILLLMQLRRRSGFLSVGTLIGYGALTIGCVFALLLPPPLNWRSQSPYRDTVYRLLDVKSGSGRVRLRQNATTFEMVKDNLMLGVGPGNWQVTYGRYAQPGDPSYEPWRPIPTNRLPHGDWLGILAERGAVAFCLLLAIGGIIIRRGWSAASKAGEGRPVAAAGLSALGAVLIAGAGDPVLLTAPGVYLVSLITAVTLPRATQRRVSGEAMRAIVVAAGLFAAGLTLAYSVRQTWATVLLRTSSPTIPVLARAARSDPGDYLSRVHLAHFWSLKGRCDFALWYSREASELFPTAMTPRLIAARCARDVLNRRQLPG